MQSERDIATDVMDELWEQRDALLDACRDLLEIASESYWRPIEHQKKLDAARIVIAKAEGKFHAY